MRRVPLVAGLVPVVVAVAGTTAFATPPDSDAAADDALAQFEQFASDEGVDIVSPSCVESDEPATYICYALTTDGAPFVAAASLSGDVIDWEIISAPDGDAAAMPEPSSPESSAPPSSDVTDASDASDASEASEEFDDLSFFHDVFSADADIIGMAIEQTQPGSPAETYARFQHVFVTVADANDTDITAGAVFRTADSVRVCVEANTCSEIRDIEVSGGQLVSFTVDGNDIAERLAATGEPVVAATTALRLDVAYQSVTGGQLIAYVELASEQGDRIDLFSAVYVGADGRQTPVAVDRSLGLDTTKLKGNHVALLAFPGAAPGGEIRISIVPADGSAAVVAVIPVEAIAP